MRESQKGITEIVVLITVTVFIGIVVYLIFQNNQTGQEDVQIKPASDISSTHISNTPNATSDSVSSWETYTNDKYGYALQYPTGWELIVKCQGGLPVDDYICFYSSDLEGAPEDIFFGTFSKGGWIWIDGQGDLVGHSVSDFCISTELMKVDECSEVTIGGKEALTRKVSNRIQVGIVENEKIILSFRLFYAPQSEEDIRRVFDQILSTFEFTN